MNNTNTVLGSKLEVLLVSIARAWELSQPILIYYELPLDIATAITSHPMTTMKVTLTIFNFIKIKFDHQIVIGFR